MYKKMPRDYLTGSWSRFKILNDRQCPFYLKPFLKLFPNPNPNPNPNANKSIKWEVSKKKNQKVLSVQKQNQTHIVHRRRRASNLLS